MKLIILSDKSLIHCTPMLIDNYIGLIINNIKYWFDNNLLELNLNKSKYKFF